MERLHAVTRFKIKCGTHSAAVGVEQATLGPPGTVSAADLWGKCDSNRVRYQYASLLRGVLSGYLERGGWLVGDSPKCGAYRHGLPCPDPPCLLTCAGRA